MLFQENIPRDDWIKSGFVCMMSTLIVVAYLARQSASSFSAIPECAFTFFKITMRLRRYTIEAIAFHVTYELILSHCLGEMGVLLMTFWNVFIAEAESV